MESNDFERNSSSSSEIIQIQPGSMKGRLKHASIVGLSVGLGIFSHGVIPRGVYGNERVTVGFLAELRRRAARRGLRRMRIWTARVEALIAAGSSVADVAF